MDEKENPQDNTSEDTPGTSEQIPETFTKEQVEEREKKAKSDALADIGRYKKEAERATLAAGKALDRVTQMLKDQDEAELESARDKPEELSAIRERQKRRTAESELTKVQQELDEKTERLTQLDADKVEVTKERNAREIATRLGVNVKSLVKLARFTDGTPEAIEDLAKELPKIGEAKTLKVDSSKTTGSSASFAKIRDEMIKNPSSDAKMRAYMEAKKAQQG